MKSNFLSNVSGSAPAAGAAAGNPQNGIPGTQAATKVGAHWFYMITQELLNVLALGAITPSATVYNQVAAAITAYITGLIPISSSFGINGYFSIAGLWLQWGTHANAADNDTVTFPHAFPNACYMVMANVINNSASSTVNVQTSGWNTTNFNLFAAGFERPPNSVGAVWFAIGH